MVQQNRLSVDVAGTPVNSKLHLFTFAALAYDPDVKQARRLHALCETVPGVTPTSIPKLIAAEVASCTSGLPQNTFLNTALGHSGGPSDQDGQAKTCVCRCRNPQRITTQTQRISTPCLRRAPAVHGFKQHVFGSHARRFADDEFPSTTR